MKTRSVILNVMNIKLMIVFVSSDIDIHFKGVGGLLVNISFPYV